MDQFLEVLTALALVANIAKNVFELWQEYKHRTEDEGDSREAR